MEEVVICKLCLEPIFNYICVNCLETSIEKWLGGFGFDNLEFKKFSENLKKKFESFFEKEKCVKCKLEAETIFCPYCYSKEVFDFLSMKNEELARNFIKNFNFDFLKIDHTSQVIETKNWVPVKIVDEESDSDLNICEDCGNQSDDIKEVNGNHICEVCRDEIKL